MTEPSTSEEKTGLAQASTSQEKDKVKARTERIMKGLKGAARFLNHTAYCEKTDCSKICMFLKKEADHRKNCKKFIRTCPRCMLFGYSCKTHAMGCDRDQCKVPHYLALRQIFAEKEKKKGQETKFEEIEQVTK